LAWGTIGDRSKPYGILAAGMENGDLEFWNPKGIMNGDANALLMRHSMHSGPVRGLDFNPFQGNLLASSSSDGEVIIFIIKYQFLINKNYLLIQYYLSF